MKKQSYVKNLLIQNNIDASVNFQNNGDIMVIPCPWSDEVRVTDGTRVRYRGGIEVDPDGRTFFKRYHDGSNGSKYELLYRTEHGVVKMTRPQIRPYNGRRRMDEEFVYVTFKFPKRSGYWSFASNIRKENREIIDFMRKEVSAWK